MGGQRRLETRFQGNNIVNHPAFGYPDASFTSGTFGAIGGNGSCLERQFQVSVRFTFWTRGSPVAPWGHGGG